MIYIGEDSRFHLTINGQVSTLVTDTLAEAMRETAKALPFLAQ
jgi:hypothetical protein